VTYADNQDKPVVRYAVMAKPIGSRCNLNCIYCYYLSKKDLLGHKPDTRISDEVLDEYIRQNIEGQTNAEEIVFSWQGGEPTLLGVDFFRRVVELERKYARPGTRIENDLQSNCTLIDEEWASFLAENNFLVGVSIDGPKRWHDLHRVDKQGKGTYDRVMQSVDLLHKHQVRFNALVTVNRDNARDPLGVYGFLRDEVGATVLQFIPIVEPKDYMRKAPDYTAHPFLPTMGTSAAKPGNPNSFVTDWSVDPDDWGDFLCAIFDEWYAHDIGKTWVMLFESAVYSALGMFSPLCTLSPVCGKCLAMEHDGSLYACDHFVYPEFYLGNILDNDIVNQVFCKQQQKFAFRKQALTWMCDRCKYLRWCYGECCKNRFIKTPQGDAGQNYLCSGYHKFFAHIEERIRKLAAEIRNNG
jgi:uncharacterized protein